MNWKALLHECVPSKYISVIIETLGNLCSVHVPAKRSKKNYVSKFHRARKILMWKKHISPSIQSKLASIEKYLISSHQKENCMRKH